MPKTVVTKPYDWTYTSTYPGHNLENAIRWRVADPEDASHEIPIAELTRQDPILFYAEIPLYEDELHDNGSSALLVRIVCFISFFLLITMTKPF
jgi:type 2A phosphatase activator TIP41